MSWVATAIVGSAVIGGIVNSNATSSAANTEANAANNASNTQYAEFEQTQANNAPWLASGENALNTLNADMPNLNTPFSYSMYQQSPAYQAQLAAGLQAITRSSAARGTLGGDTLKALTNYGQNAANADYQQAFQNYNTNQTNTFNRLSQMAGMGQTAAAQNQAAGTNAANNISSNTMAAGNAQAAGTIAGANNITSTIGTGMNTWMGSQYLNQFNGAGTQTGSNPTTGWNPPQYTMPQLGAP